MTGTTHQAAHPFPLALSPPAGDITLIGDRMIGEALAQSRKSPRGRIILPLHKNDEAPVHRMLNCIQPGSYIRPHTHLHPPRIESVIVLRGVLMSLHFSDLGDIVRADRLAPGTPFFGVDSEPGQFHSFLALAPDTVIFEIKPGPYRRSSDKDFAQWAPEEGSADAAEYLTRITRLAKALNNENDQ